LFAFLDVLLSLLLLDTKTLEIEDLEQRVYLRVNCRTDTHAHDDNDMMMRMMMMISPFVHLGLWAPSSGV
jgi:hypothetical protein